MFSAANVLGSARVDSTGVENWNGKQVVIYKVDAKETYYSISKKYHVSPQKVMDYNASIPLKIGSVIKIPTDRAYQQTVEVSNIIEYKVHRKETLYSIAGQFHMSMDEIKQLNNLKDYTLKTGQILKVKQTATVPAPAGSQQANQTVPVNTQTVPTVNKSAYPTLAEADSIENVDTETRINNAAARYGLREVIERGVATSMDEEGSDGSKMLVLHRTAPVGTVVKITNPMTGKSTFAKVVGKFAENQSTKDVIIVISKAAANLIGALDKRFQVNIVYGVPNE
jgi:LysM repeat protein